MKFTAFSVAAAMALTSHLSNAANHHDHEHFQTFADAIYQFEYDWEPYNATTDDGYILTLFRLQGLIGHRPVHRTAMQSILIMPGIGMSADSWF